MSISFLAVRLLDLAMRIQQIPAPTFEEGERAEFVKTLMELEGLQDISIDTAHNVVGRLPGRGDGLPLIMSAHLDTVFPLATDLSIARQVDRIGGPGIGDNSLGVATLFGLLWLLCERGISLPGDLWLVGNSCEEGLGDLRGMRAVVDRFGTQVCAYLVIEGVSLGYIQHRALGVQRYRISAHTAGGHSWSDYGRPSSLHELSKLVARLDALTLPVNPRTTMNVGRMCGGTSVNTIAAEAWLELDLRSESPDMLAKLAWEVEELVGVANKPEVRVEAQVIGQRPAGELSIRHPLVKLAKKSLQDLSIEPKLTIGSTDANIPLSRGLPALVLGVTSGAGAHTTEECIYTEPVERGLEHLVNFVSKAWG